jgi:hypothetical protein
MRRRGLLAILLRVQFAPARVVFASDIVYPRSAAAGLLMLSVSLDSHGRIENLFALWGGCGASFRRPAAARRVRIGAINRAARRFAMRSFNGARCDPQFHRVFLDEQRHIGRLNGMRFRNLTHTL